MGEIKTEKGQGDKGEGWEKGENLMNSEHKAVSEKYREGYEQIRWDDDMIIVTIRKEARHGPVYGHFV